MLWVCKFEQKGTVKRKRPEKAENLWWRLNACLLFLRTKPDLNLFLPWACLEAEKTMKNSCSGFKCTACEWGSQRLLPLWLFPTLYVFSVSGWFRQPGRIRVLDDNPLFYTSPGKPDLYCTPMKSPHVLGIDPRHPCEAPSHIGTPENLYQRAEMPLRSLNLGWNLSTHFTFYFSFQPPNTGLVCLNTPPSCLLYTSDAADEDSPV